MMINAKKFCLGFICMFLCCTCPCSSQSISIREYQNENEPSSCQSGLLYDYDTYTIIAEVDCKSQNTELNLYFSYKPKHYTEFTNVCGTIDFTETNKNTEVCNVTVRAVNNCIYNISVSVTASRLLSGATLQAAVVTNDNKHTKSNNITLSELYNITSSTVYLIVNGKDIPTDQQSDIIEVSSPDMTITGVCVSEAVPCFVEISTNGTADVVQQKGHASHRQLFDKPTHVRLLLKHAACRLDGKFNVLQFNFHINPPLPVTEIKNNCTTEIALLVILVVLLCIFFVVKWYRNRRESQLFRNVSSSRPCIVPDDDDTVDDRISALRSEANNQNVETERKGTAKHPSKEIKRSKPKADALLIRDTILQ